MLSRDIQGALMNNTNIVDCRPYPIRALGQARCLRKDGPKRGGTKQANQIRVATGPTKDATKTKALKEIDSCESNRDNCDTESSGGNNDTNHAEAPSDSTYCEGDE
jgi:hypothetical protein